MLCILYSSVLTGGFTVLWGHLEREEGEGGGALLRSTVCVVYQQDVSTGELEDPNHSDDVLTSQWKEKQI